MACATAVLNPERLTDAQVGQVWAYSNNSLMAAQNTWLAYSNGLASKESWDYAKRYASAHVGFRFGSIWWRSTTILYDPSFVEAIDKEVVESDAFFIERAMREIVDEIRKLESDEAK